MVSEIFPVVASDQYAEKNSLPNTLHLGLPPCIISKGQLPFSSTIVRHTLHDEEIYSEKDKSLGLSRLRAIVNCLQAKSTKTCVKQQNVMV